MNTTKVAITLNKKTLDRLDQLVRNRMFPSRSRAIQEVVEEKLDRLDRSRLARDCAKLDPVEEKAMAEECLSEELDHIIEGLNELIGN